jgi:hypothetical protein
MYKELYKKGLPKWEDPRYIFKMREDLMEKNNESGI